MTSNPQARASLEVTAVLHALADPVRLDLVRQLRESDTAIACGRFDTPVTRVLLATTSCLCSATRSDCCCLARRGSRPGSDEDGCGADC
jgi:hypothetical protein